MSHLTSLNTDHKGQGGKGEAKREISSPKDGTELMGNRLEESWQLLSVEGRSTSKTLTAFGSSTRKRNKTKLGVAVSPTSLEMEK